MHPTLPPPPVPSESSEENGSQPLRAETKEEENSRISATEDENETTNSVDENAVVGTEVGITATASDVDAGDRVTYSLEGYL